ncbi:MAG: hypothetical protein WA208_09545 [Thermoanaerobaculia bacterium]
MDRTVLLLVAGLAIYCGVLLAVGRFTGVDEVAFKAAGREWAQSGRFAAPELQGFLDVEPPVEEVWFGHMPLYTFAFGVFVKVLGFGPSSSVLFDALIHALLAALTFWVTLRFSADGDRRPALLAALAVLPLGVWGRADELAMCLGMAAVLVVSFSRLGAGLLLGCTAVTSVVAAAVFGLIAVGLLFVSRSVHPIRRALSVFLISLVSAAGLLAPLLTMHPGALRQFLAHGVRQSPDYRYGLAFTLTYGRSIVLSLVAALIVIAFAAVRSGRRDVRNLQRLAVIVALSGLLLALFPAKYYYLWFLGPLGIAFGSLAIAERLVRAPVVVVAFALYLGATTDFARSVLISAALPQEQRLSANVEIADRLIEPGSVVLASEFWSSIADRVRYRSLVHGIPDMKGVDYVILTSNGAGGPGRVQWLAPRLSAGLEQFEVVHENLPRDVPRFLGVPLSHSAWGFGTRILRRVDPRAAAEVSRIGVEGEVTP